MSSKDIQQLCESTRAKLNESIELLEMFLNYNALPQLLQNEDLAMEAFYRGYLQDMRALLVFSQVSSEKLGVCLRRPTFNNDFSEKVLYEVYHSCINAFFYPKNESYSEDGRYAYTGKDAIRFNKKPIRIVRDLTLGLSKMFELLRENLMYYESDYVNHRRMQGERI
jgi:hypothetical protein